MKILRKPFLLSLLMLLASYLGCSSTKVKLNTEKQDQIPHMVALLPIKAAVGVRTERLNYLQDVLRRQLENKGYFLLDQKVLNELCPNADCDQKKLLGDPHYPIAGIFSLELKSLSDNAFLVGYYNVIDGRLKLTDKNNKELVSVEHAETERGGILFDSGQLIQGIIAQTENAGDNSFNLLANKFAREITAALPAPALGSANNTTASEVEITSVQAEVIKPSIYKICASATAGELASLLVGRERSNLREITPGKYCGIYRLENSSPNFASLAVEIKSPFGSETRKQVELAKGESCNLSGRVSLVKLGDKSGVKLNCLTTDASCLNEISNCSSQKLLIFKGSAENGPFIKVAEVTAQSWTDERSTTKSNSFYQVVAVNNRGVFSLPVLAQ